MRDRIRTKRSCWQTLFCRTHWTTLADLNANRLINALFDHLLHFLIELWTHLAVDYRVGFEVTPIALEPFVEMKLIAVKRSRTFFGCEWSR